jgi:hypothetical protein
VNNSLSHSLSKSGRLEMQLVDDAVCWDEP